MRTLPEVLYKQFVRQPELTPLFICKRDNGNAVATSVVIIYTVPDGFDFLLQQAELQSSGFAGQNTTRLELYVQQNQSVAGVRIASKYNIAALQDSVSVSGLYIPSGFSLGGIATFSAGASVNNAWLNYIGYLVTRLAPGS